MVAALDSVVSLYNEIKSEFTKPKPNLTKCGTILDQLKVSHFCSQPSHLPLDSIIHILLTSLFCAQVALTKLVFLPTGDSAASQRELIVARDILEIAVQYSVATKDIPAFERFMSQLKCYYFDYK